MTYFFYFRGRIGLWMQNCQQVSDAVEVTLPPRHLRRRAAWQLTVLHIDLLICSLLQSLARPFKSNKRGTV